METAETEGVRVVVVKFGPNPARSAALTAANLPILSKAYYSKQAFDETSMEPPLGSGPYKVGKFEQGRFQEFERVKDWWGEEAAGHARAEQLRRAALRLFPRPRYRVRRLTAKSYTFREEFTSRVWASRYDFPAIKDGRSSVKPSPTTVPPACKPG